MLKFIPSPKGRHSIIAVLAFVFLVISNSCKKESVKAKDEGTLPVININTNGGEAITSKDNYIEGSISISGADPYPDITGNLQIKGHGNSTWLEAKKPYKFKLDKKQSLLGMPKDKTWILLANYFDKTQLRNQTAFELGNISALDWTPHAQFAELYLNNMYQGTYQLTESIKAADSRVNVTDEGYVLEVDQESRLDPDDIYFKTSRMLMSIKDPDLAEGDAQYAYIKDYVTSAENVLYGSNFKDPTSGYAKYLDVNSFVDWYLINEITKNNDAVFFSSCYMNLAPNGKLKMGPIWDFDIAFGQKSENGDDAAQGFWVKNSIWISRLFEDPSFVQKVKTRFKFFREKEEVILNSIDSGADQLYWPNIENNNKWQILAPASSPNSTVWNAYDSEVATMKDWLKLRMDWLEDAFNKM